MILKACLVALLSAQTADAITTAKLLGPGFREGNPLLPQNRIAIVAIKGAATGSLVLAGWKIRKQHPKLAIALFAAGAASGTYGTVHNVRLVRRR